MSFFKKRNIIFITIFTLILFSLCVFKVTNKNQLIAVSISDKTAANPHLTGGKGSSLSLLDAITGISVPEGFIITTHAYAIWLKANPRIQKEIIKLDGLSQEEEIIQQCSVIRKFIFQSNMPKKVLRAVEKKYTKLGFGEDKNINVAVRSSGTAEDLPEASFAGQYDTYLNQRSMEDVLNSIKGCFASLFHPHAVQYRNRFMQSNQKLSQSLKHSEIKIAVVIQKLIHSKVSGVGFNISPEGVDEIYIETNYGLGESLVQGLANPDTWTIDRKARQIIRAQLGSKTIKTIGDHNNGTIDVTTSKEQQSRYSISSDKILKIAQNIRRIAHHFKTLGIKYIDTEFAVDQEGRIYFLQARPETVFSSMTSLKVKGIPINSNTSNRLVFNGGSCGYLGASIGKLRIVSSPQEAIEKVENGDILLTKETSPEWSIIFPKLGGIIVDYGGALSHAAILGRELRLPTLLSANHACNDLSHLNGKMVTLDATNKKIYEGIIPLQEGNIEDFKECDFQENNFYMDQNHQTVDYVDDAGNWWIKKPAFKMTPLQLEFIENGYKYIENLLGIPINFNIKGDYCYVIVEDVNRSKIGYAKIKEILIQWKIEELERILERRISSEKELVIFSSHFNSHNIQHLIKFKQLYQNWINQYLLRGRFGHGALATLMEMQLEKIPNPNLLDAYLQYHFPLRNLSLEKNQEFRKLQNTMNKLGYSNSKDIYEIMHSIQKKNPELWDRILKYAKSYEHIASQSFTINISAEEILEQLLSNVEQNCIETEVSPMSKKEIELVESWFEKDPEMKKIMILSHKHVYQKENEHHRISKANHFFYEGFMNLGKTFANKGILSNPEDIFQYKIDDLIAFCSENFGIGDGV